MRRARHSFGGALAVGAFIGSVSICLYFVVASQAIN